MDPARSSGDGSGDSGRHNPGLAEVDRFYEEIQSLMKFDPAPENGSSFMSLLGLPANQAMELLHEAEPGDAPATPSAAEIWGSRRRDQKPLLFPPHCGCSPTFPSTVGLVERAARFSVFSADDSPQTTSSGGPSNSGGHSPKAVKAEPADADSNPIISSSPNEKQPQRSGKRKEREKSKAKAAASKSRGSSDDGIPKPAEENKCGGSGGEKLPYVHVRARRGQATDNHSLAERARREKINARMKLLQELVPGCSKISGTAMVLDEIINHVQYLQRQVEFLSMRLAAVNRRIDFSGLDCFLAAAEEENDGRVTTTGNVGSTLGSEASPLWPEVQADVVRRQHQPIWQSSSPPPPPEWGGDDDDHRYPFVSPGVSLLCYDPANSVPLHADQLKTEL